MTVMTRNLYLGADIARPIAATARQGGRRRRSSAFGNANCVTRAIVDQTDFPARAKLLAREIVSAQARPRRPPGGHHLAPRRREPDSRIGSASAGRTSTTTSSGRCAADLQKRKSRYQVVRAQQESRRRGPGVHRQANPLEATGFNARLTIRDVLLRRRTSKYRVTEARLDAVHDEAPLRRQRRRHRLHPRRGVGGRQARQEALPRHHHAPGERERPDPHRAGGRAARPARSNVGRPGDRRVRLQQRPGRDAGGRRQGRVRTAHGHRLVHVADRRQAAVRLLAARDTRTTRATRTGSRRPSTTRT